MASGMMRKGRGGPGGGCVRVMVSAVHPALRSTRSSRALTYLDHADLGVGAILGPTEACCRRLGDRERHGERRAPTRSLHLVTGPDGAGAPNGDTHAVPLNMSAGALGPQHRRTRGLR